MTAPEFTAFFKRQYGGFVSTMRENNVKFELFSRNEGL